MKPFTSVKKYKKSLFIFEHGLGDLINYLHVHQEFCNQTQKKVKLIASDKRQFHLIDPNILSLHPNNDSVSREYDYVYRINYPDSTNSTPPIEFHDESAKPYLCAFYELGMKDFTWTPYKMKGFKIVGIVLTQDIYDFLLEYSKKHNRFINDFKLDKIESLYGFKVAIRSD